MAEEQKKDGWDKVGVLSGLIASILIPLVVAIVGNSYSTAIKESENRIKYIELAISILKDKPSPETHQIRSWAVQVVDRYSDVPLPAQAREQLLKRRLTGNGFEEMDLSNSSFDGSLLTRSSFRRSVLRGASFDEADLRGADLSRAVIDQTTKLPK